MDDAFDAGVGGARRRARLCAIRSSWAMRSAPGSRRARASTPWRARGDAMPADLSGLGQPRSDRSSAHLMRAKLTARDAACGG
ncbi:hypothetical protein, partial [Phenylobacterium aquaticum]|uniref:hypothetical protein n=1 Tax=Phenylobacterium aquaticum TaxID=1763816 RepID=UPI001F5C29D9